MHFSKKLTGNFYCAILYRLPEGCTGTVLIADWSVRTHVITSLTNDKGGKCTTSNYMSIINYLCVVQYSKERKRKKNKNDRRKNIAIKEKSIKRKESKIKQ